MRQLLWFFMCLSVAWSEPTRISFWHAFGGERESRLQQLVDVFQRENPEILVELKGFTDPRKVGNDYAELYKNLTSALGQGHPPVLAQMYENWVTQMAEVKVLLPLDKDLGGTWRDMPAVFLKASTHADGRRYSVPFNKSLWTLYANKEQWEGTDPPQNWSEFRVACAGLRDRFPQGVVAVPSPFEMFDMHFVSQGGRFFDARRQPSFAGPLGMSSAGYLLGLAGQDRTCIFGAGAYQHFVQGRMPFLIDTSAKLAVLEEKLGDKLVICPLPRGAGDKIQLTGTQLSIFSASDVRQRRSALRLLRYLTAPEQTRNWAMATGYLPIRQSVYEDPIYVEYLKARPGRAVISGSLSRAQVQPQVVGWEATRVLINDALERSLYQSKPIDKELFNAQSTTARLVRGLQGKP
ncbi:extracellular solute-binding protein [bacterium]|nr:extracellular solute-binding protein [bacterium]